MLGVDRQHQPVEEPPPLGGCLLYTSDAADERSSVDLGGRRIIKKKKNRDKAGVLDEREILLLMKHDRDST